MRENQLCGFLVTVKGIMADPYVTAEELKSHAVASEADSDTIFVSLAEAVSRMFDRECEVEDGFFLPAAYTASDRVFKANGTEWLDIGAVISGSITSLNVNGIVLDAATDYETSKNYIKFLITPPEAGASVTINARFGFADVPADIKFACIEQALAMWRRKDTAFAEISGVASAVVNAEFTPTFLSTTRRYAAIYGHTVLFG